MLTHDDMIIPGDAWFILDRMNKKQTNCSVQDSELETRSTENLHWTYSLELQSQVIFLLN